MGGGSRGDPYDVVVVGGGAAGCVLASRLSEAPGRRVLLLEAGMDVVPGREPPDILDIYPGRAYLNPAYTWTDLRVATEIVPHNRPDAAPKLKGYEQARVLGGGSSINGQMANRGAPDDYDEWERRGATGWGWTDVLPFFRKLETDLDFGGDLHGTEGPIQISRIGPDRWPGHAKAIGRAFEEAGYPRLEDQNGPFRDGWFPLALSNVRGRRITAATAYLTAEVRRRPSLHIKTDTRVSSLLMDGVVCRGVEVVGPDGRSEKIAAHEVVLAAGALQSPAILLRAGIGPGTRLRELGIPVRAHRQGVGRSLTDHPAVALAAHLRPAARLNGITGRHMLLGLRYSSGLEGGRDGDMFVIGVSKSAWHAIGDQIGSMLVSVYQTLSQSGTVDLASADPRDMPVVRFNLLSDRRDLDRLIDGVRRTASFYLSSHLRQVASDPFPASYNESVKKVGRITAWNAVRTWLAGSLADASPALRRAIYGRFIHGRHSLAAILGSDDEMEEFVRRDSIGLWHASCSCRMGAPSDPDAVTDPTGRVHGTAGLRVADASVFPSAPRANTAIPTTMVAERISSLMLRSG